MLILSGNKYFSVFFSSFPVLGSLDDQLAREQSQDTLNRTSIHYDSRRSETSHYPIVSPHGVPGGVQHSSQSMFLSDGTRTLRAKDEHRTFSRPRVFYGTYTRRHHTADYTYGDASDRRSPALRRGHSSRSLGHSSEGSLQLPSGPYTSGFGHKDSTAVNRSYSSSCLSRGQSLASVDQLSATDLHYPLESNRGCTQRSYHQQSKRTPLSSIVWNTPQSSENLPYTDRLLRTQSLMEFGPTFEETYPCSPQENTRYEFYRSKDCYRRGVPNTTHSLFANRYTDPLYFGNRDNYLLHQREKNSSKSCYRYPSFHSRVNLPHKSFGPRMTEDQHFRPDSHQDCSDEVFYVSDADFESIPSNLGNWPNVCVEESGLQIRKPDSQDHIWGIDHPEGVRNRLFTKHPNNIQRHTAYGRYGPKSQIKRAVQHNLLTGQNPSETYVKHFQADENSPILASQEVKNPPYMLSGKMENEQIKGEKVRLVSGQRDVSSPSESCISPPSAPLIRKSTKLTSIRNIEKMYFSSLQKRREQRNRVDCVVNSDPDQMHPSFLTANRSATAVNQNSQDTQPSEKLGAFVDNSKASTNICPGVFSKDSEELGHDKLPYSCALSIHKHNRFVNHGISSSIAASVDNNTPESPTVLQRKSASIDGSVLSEKPLSQFHLSGQISCRNKKNGGDNLEVLGSSKIENIYSKESAKITLSPNHSSLSLSSKDFASSEIPQTNDNRLQLTQDSQHFSVDTSTLASTLEKQVCDPDKSEISVVSECEEECTRNPLQQYKTTSTLTVSIEEDNVKYQELISVYYTLPRKRSRTLCNLFRDDTKMDADSSSPTRKSPPHQKKCARAHLPTAAFTSGSEKDKKEDSLGNMVVAVDTQHNPKMSGDVTKKGTHMQNTAEDRGATVLSQSLRHDKNEAASTEELEFSKSIERLGVLTDPKTVDDSLGGGISTPWNHHIYRYRPPPLDKGPSIDTSSNFKLSKSREDKISLGNLGAASSAMNNQKGSHLLLPPSTEPASSNNSHIPPSYLVDNNMEGKHTAESGINTAINYTKYSIRQDPCIKEEAYCVSHNISRKPDELQLKNESGSQEGLMSEPKMCSDIQKQSAVGDVHSTVYPAFQPNMSASEHRKYAQPKEPLNSSVHNICKTLQTSVTDSADNQNSNSKDQLISTVQSLSDNSAPENKNISDCTKDKTSDIEKRKNRPSIKNKLAAIYKTSRKFSSKKSLPQRPHISNIFSQNDTPCSETSNSHSMSGLPETLQVFLQTGNENQNQNLLAGEFDDTALHQPGNKKSETNEAPQLITNEVRRPFANLCNQKHESPSPRLSDRKPGDKQHSTVLFSKESVSKLSSCSQTYDKRMENSHQPTFSRIPDSGLNRKKESSSNVSQPVFSSLLSDKNANIVTADYSKAAPCSPQEVIIPTESGPKENTKCSNRLSSPNLSCVEPVLNPNKTPRERHFSECSYAGVLHDRPSSGAGTIQSGSRYSRKFKSQSELLSCDENVNWEATSENRAFGSRRVMYPSIEFGIFGKEQQQAFLDNIKRSLTEGRLWRPYFLSNARSLRKEASVSLSRPELLSSRVGERSRSAEGASPQVPSEAQGQDSVDYSDTNSDTTTDDEYYLDGNDKESEL